MADSDFARRMLEKQGWTDGDGLGKKKNGISKPIKVNLKVDKAGVGHSIGTDFNDHWWLRVFNEAASSNSSSNKPLPAPEKPLPQNVLYSGFRKGSILNNAKEDKTSDCSSEDEDPVDPAELPTLDDLHKFCGGATGHRAATLGIKMEGKLKRAAEQERLFHEKSKNKTVDGNKGSNQSSEEDQNIKKKKKKKKNKRHDQSESETTDASMAKIVDGEINTDSIDGKKRLSEEHSEPYDENIVVQEKTKKKKSKKKRQREEAEEPDSGKQESIETSVGEAGEAPSGKKRKKSKKDVGIENVVETEEVVLNNDDIGSSKPKKKKKKKQKS